MIRQSTTVSHGYAIPSDGKGISYLLPLKSKFSGDDASIRSFQFRAMSAEASVGNEILSSNGGHDIGTATVSIVPKKRPALMHQHGVLFETGTAGVPFAKAVGSAVQVDIGTVTMLFKPVSGTTRIARGALTIDITSAGVVTYTGAQTLYVNGAVVTTGSTIAFPYPRLLTVAYTATAASPVVVGASTGTASFYLQSLATTQRLMNATDVDSHARAYYRRPNSVTVLTDSAISSVPSDATVTVPATWLEF